MNSTPTNKDKNTNAKSTPQAVFNYAQAAKRNSQNSEQQKAKPTGQNNKPASNPLTPPPKQQTIDDTTTSAPKANGNSNVNGSTKTPVKSAQSSSKPTFAAVANVSSAKQGQQSPRNASVQLPRAPPVDKSSIQFGSINQATETATQSTSETTKQEGQGMESTINSGNASAAADKPALSQSRRDSTQSNPSASEQSPAQSPHYQNASPNNNGNRHYNGPRHYNQGKHTSYSPNMNNAQSGYMPHHAKKPISPHMASASPSVQSIPVAQNSWTNPIPGQYYAAPSPQYYSYGQMPVQSYGQPGGARQGGGQQNFVPQAARTSKAIPIIDPNTKTQVKADPLAPATSPSKSATAGDKKEKDFKIQTSPSPKRTITIVDPAVKELEEREKREKEEAERAAKEEAERKAKEEAERAAKEEADRLAKEEADRLAKEEAERKAKEEAERAAKEEAERLAKEEADRKAKEEADRKAKEEAEKVAKEEAERKERAAAAAAAVAEAERKVREECERNAAAERKVMEDEIQRVKRQLAGRTDKNEEQRIAAITAEKATKPAPGRLDLSGIPTHVLEGEPQTQSPSSPSSAAATPLTPTPPQKVIIPQRKITDFSAIQYPENVTKAPTNSSGRIQYVAEFLLQFRALVLDSNEDLSAFQNIGDEANERGSGSGRSHSNRRQPSERGGRGPRTPGGDMHRNNSRDGRMDSMGKFSGGRPLAHRAGSGNVSSPGSPGGMQRDGSHGGRSRSGRGGGKGRHPPREQQGGPTIPLDQVVPLEKSENRWMPAVVATSGEAAGVQAATKNEDDLISQEMIIRKVKSLLNKLTLEKFDSISDQIWDYAHQSAKEKDGESLLTVIQLIFDKACDEPAFASMWAQLCRKLHDTMAAADDIVDENNALDKNGNKITSGHLFRKYLLNRCQQAFERGWKFEIPDLEKSVSGEVMMTDEYYAAVKAKRQGLGLVQFIGELFKRGMLADRIMTECLTRLCRNPQEAEDEETETMCKLVTTVGRELDRRNRNMKQWMDAFFERMKEMLDCTTLTSRVKFMIQDVLELRRSKWVPRGGAAAAGPSTISQIREDAQKAKNEEKESMKRTSSSRGNTPQSMSRQGSRASRQNSQREHASSKNTETSAPAAAATTTSDGWSTVGTATTPTPKGRTNDLDGFGRTDRSKSRNNVLGPGSSPFQTLNRSGTKNAKSDSKKGSPADSRSSSPASSMINMFSALGGEGHDEPAEQPTERRKLNLLPRGATLPTNEQTTPVNEEPVAAKPKLTEQQMEQKAKDIIEEYILLRDEKELILCVKELEAPLPLVNKMLGVVEKKDDEVKGVCEMIGVLNKENLVEKDSYVEALKPFMEMYEDLTIDVPQAPKYMSQLLAAMNVDPAEVMEVEELDDSGYIPASTKLKQLYDEIKASA